ncbi:MAG TPA: hypothetical protein PLT66_00705, partial [Bacillota bacterium]|nr:hypothetical protein [Bacillota bacterium]
FVCEGVAQCDEGGVGSARLLFPLSYAAAMCFGDPVGIMADSTACADIMMAGVRAAGKCAVYLGSANEAVCAYAVRRFSLAGALLSRGGKISLFDRFSLPPTREDERKITSLSASGIKPAERYGESDDVSHLLSLLYEAEYPLPPLPDGCRISDCGTHLVCSLCSHYELLYLCLTEAIHRKIRTFAVPSPFPEALTAHLVSLGASVVHYTHTPADSSENASRAVAASMHMLRDARALGELLVSYLSRTGQTLGEAIGKIPFAVNELTHPADADKLVLTVSALKKEENSAESDDGVRLVYDSGCVTVIPSPEGFRLFAEAVSAETARELCAFTEDKIDNLYKNKT